ncbi:hypothetical protein [Dyadobacter sandarakinus]|uniref:Uncharacterized protein n=1 Tax=Dyadobacter sandarakinus TaxID=2747268 RepID=A0ABX7I508_9BACT|nr:hypothetical protein [Dyadobacter sandarakinus]QRR01179.1 hypothetical protein HWI92_09815 [Dyadobacter sandarakinus]
MTEHTEDYDMPTMVNAAFTDKEKAQLAFDELTYRGYEESETSYKADGTSIILSFTPRTVEDRLEVVTAWVELGAQLLHGNENYTA